MIAVYPFVPSMASSVFAAGVDVAGIGSVVAGITAMIALILGHRNSRRAAQTTESVSYVDNNLKTMQATLDWLTKDNTRLREVNEEQRLSMVDMHEEMQQLRLELATCKELCTLMGVRLGIDTQVQEQIGNLDVQPRGSERSND